MTHEPLLPPKASQILMTYSLLSAMCPLIPVPFLDDFVLEKLNTSMNKALFRQYGIHLDDDEEKILRETPGEFWKSLGISIVQLPFNFVFVRVFMAKTCTDFFTKVLHEGWLLTRALEAGHIDLDMLRQGKHEQLRQVRRAILATTSEITTSPMTMAIKSLFRLRPKTFLNAATYLVNFFGPDQATERQQALSALQNAGLGEVLNALMSTLATEKGYFQALEAQFVAHLDGTHHPN